MFHRENEKKTYTPDILLCLDIEKSTADDHVKI